MLKYINKTKYNRSIPSHKLPLIFHILVNPLKEKRFNEREYKNVDLPG